MEEKIKRQGRKPCHITIPAAGVEPARPCGHWILSSIPTFFETYNLDLIRF